MNDDDMEMAEMVISDNNAYLMAMGTGSRIEIHGADAQKETWTALDSTAQAGSNQLVVEDSTGWEVGDKIAITSTEMDWEESEDFTILAISDDGKTITLDGELGHTHRGEVKEYNNGKDPSDPDYLEWEVEVQAEVALLSRNVTIQGDADSVDDGFGGHTMVMNGAEQHIEGAEFFQMGQSGILGRYPVHWHLLGDEGEGQYVQNISVHNTYQKGITIHGTNNVRVEDVVIYDHFGHGLFLENGTETGNLVLGNLVFDTKIASDGEGSIPTDETKTSSYWIENPDNVFIGNHAGGSEANGFWIFQPDDTTVSDIIFRANTAHSTASHSLGISGFIQTNLNFRESQFDTDYAVIKDFTAWEAGSSVWAHSTNVVYDGLELYDADLFTMGENTFLDMLIVNDDRLDQISTHPAAQGAITLYRREGGNEFDGLHLEGFEGVQFDTVGSDLLQQPHVIVNYTDDLASLLPHIDQTQPNTGNGHKFLDIDGSFTGIEGAVLVPNGNGETEWLQVPIGTEYKGVPLESFISETNIGTLTISDGDDTKSSITISRHDGLSGVLDDNDYGSVIHQPVADTQDYAFLIEFPEAKTDATFALRDLREGDSAIYEIANVASVGDISGAVEANSFDEMMRLDESSYILTGDTIVLRLVGGEPIVDPDRALEDPAQDYRAEAIVELEGIVQPGNPTEYGDAEFTAELLTALEDQPARAEHGPVETGEASLPRTDADFELTPYASTSETTEVHDGLPRWSDPDTWGEAGMPGPNDTVVIGEGQTVVLDVSDVLVAGIIVDGGELIIEDELGLSIDLATDYLLVINGGLFQAGTEDDLLDTDFTLTLEGDDPDFDLMVSSILRGEQANTVFSVGETVESEPEDVVYGDGENNVFDGTADADTYYGRAGNDTIYGGESADDLRGGKDDDMLSGEDDNDRLYGNGGEDDLRGGEGDDKLYGGGDDDHLNGGLGDDLLRGGDGDDVIHGGGGSDHAKGGDGNDFIYNVAWAKGGEGEDTFAFDSAYMPDDTGKIVIRDFEAGTDSILLDTEAKVKQAGDHVRITMDGADFKIVVKNADADEVADTLQFDLDYAAGSAESVAADPGHYDIHQGQAPDPGTYSIQLGTAPEDLMAGL